jgi:RNA polymerase-binding transcription factor DksA
MAIKKKAAKPAKKTARPTGGSASKKNVAKKAAPKKAAKVVKSAPKKADKPIQKKAAKKVVAAKPVAKHAPAVKHGAKPAPHPHPKQASIVKHGSKDHTAAKPAHQPAAKPAQHPAVKPAHQPPAKPGSGGFKPAHTPPRPQAKKEPSKPVKVVIPEIKTKSAVKYQPDFTKSVLDTPQSQIQTGPTMRYSDVELAEFKEIILKKLEAAKKELAYLQGLITRKDEMGGDESENRYMTMEDGSVSMEREQLAQMASRQITFIDHLEKALVRIENKTYGICRVTGKLIDKARLRAVPHATLSIEAKQMQHK